MKSDARRATTCRGSFGADGFSDTLSAANNELPFGAQKVENKICESCGLNFLRPQSSNDKYCRDCHGRYRLEEPERASGERHHRSNFTSYIH